MVEFDAVSMAFASGHKTVTDALIDVSFAVPRGQFCVVLGPSGSGKSTLLRVVNGMLRPTGGQVLFDGQALTDKRLPAVQQRVGMVHQQFNLVARASVLDNVVSGALPAIATARVLFKFWPGELQRRACRLLARVGLTEDHLYRRAARLSGGQQQRVAIARAFMLEPDVVLADEPVASLDPATSENVLRLLASASKETDTTVLCSLHQVELARKFADRIVALHDGRMAFDGAPAELSDSILAEVYADAPGGDAAVSTGTKAGTEAGTDHAEAAADGR